MAEKGVNVPFGLPVKSVEEVSAALLRSALLACRARARLVRRPTRSDARAQAVAAAAKIGDAEVVIKSQILAGGRGLGTFTNGFKGGVHVIKTSQAAG